MPFHLAALEATGAAFHDENLLKTFRFAYENGDGFVTKVLTCFRSLKTQEGQKRYLDTLIQSSDGVPTSELLSVFAALHKVGSPLDDEL